jgi:hypothetical protein
VWGKKPKEGRVGTYNRAMGQSLQVESTPSGSFRYKDLQEVAHASNPSYSGGRDQEDHGLKPSQPNSSQDPILKKPITKKGLME